MLGNSQGIAYAVGEAIAEKHLSEKFPEISHYIYVITTHEDLQDGLSQEALEYAATNKLNNLIILVDSNSSEVEAFSRESLKTNFAKKYSAMNIDYKQLKDASPEAIIKAIANAKKSSRLSIIDIESTIKENSIKKWKYENPDTYLSDDYFEAIKEKSLFNKLDNFEIYEEVKTEYRNKFLENHEKAERWTYSDRLDQFISDNVKENINDAKISDFNKLEDKKAVFLNNLADKYENILVASLDQKWLRKLKTYNGVFANNNLSGRLIYSSQKAFSVASIASGLSAHSNYRPIVLAPISSLDYVLPAIKNAAADNTKILYIFDYSEIYYASLENQNTLMSAIKMARDFAGFQTFIVNDESELKGSFEYYLNEASKPVIIFLNLENKIKSNFNSKLEIKSGLYYLNNQKSDYTLISSGENLNLAAKIAQKFNFSLISISNNSNIADLNKNKTKKILLDFAFSEKIAKYVQYQIILEPKATIKNEIFDSVCEKLNKIMKK
ncbi:hypothetical protein [Mycoplasma struthionis]|uniref:Transketolase N-terminal domain-containing protein n=1 Tax=Mycoplasma struthionis TaxID=538220 RepID=A0A502M8P5_9MOLU|nr:hypothetical protein [Mycoplasma struthionis]TPI01580.1 hypothetical protein FJM01_02365 [Mycoplasma struthionis]